ncbi:TlpA family protein disulfide reductase [Planctomicrobium sp. SH661]|uniref:TlpA family protein disulfide reductase n=1 Tax=Planctomicrobium sp. SH661 TaxID=3448124 RepID=UPI003F5BE2CE
MLRRFSYTAFICCLVGMTAYLMNRSNHAADPVPAPKQNAPQTPPEPAGATAEVDPFAVPEGTDDKALMMFLQRIVKLPPEETTPDAIVKHLNKVDGAVGEILGREVSDDVYHSVSDLRLQLYAALLELGDKSVEARKTAFLKELGESPRASIKGLLRQVSYEDRLMKFPTQDAAAQTAFVDEVAAMVQAAPADSEEEIQFSVQLAMVTAQVLEDMKSPLTNASYQKLIKAIEARKDPRLDDIVENLQGTLRRLELPGHPIEISGTTIDGKEFDIREYKGKVVLVDYWATWCAPCVAEIPFMKQVYAAYHDKGFEIVGVSLDEDPEQLSKFVASRGINWVTLVGDDKDGLGWKNKNAARYAITMLPHMILVNQEGNVVAVHAGGLRFGKDGASLQTELEKLLGPLPKAADAPNADQILKPVLK